MSKAIKTQQAREELELKKLAAEVERIQAECEKLKAEASKITRERAFYIIAGVNAIALAVSALAHAFR